MHLSYLYNWHYYLLTALVNNGDRIVLQRADEGGLGINTAYAWEEGVPVEQMQRVAWDAADKIWYKWDSATNDWALLNGNKLKWNSTSQKFE